MLMCVRASLEDYVSLKTLMILFIASVDGSRNFTPIPGGSTFPDISVSS